MALGQLVRYLAKTIMLRKLSRMLGIDSSRKIELLRLLTDAELKLRCLGDKPVWSSYESGPAIADFVARARIRIEDGTISQAEQSELWGIFAPTCDWDDVVGDVELGNSVFSILDSMYGGTVRFSRSELEGDR